MSKDNHGNIPLIWASRYGLIEIVKYLLEKGANINHKNDNGNTPLIWASLFGRLEVVKFLVEKGADLEAKNNFGYTPNGPPLGVHSFDLGL